MGEHFSRDVGKKGVELTIVVSLNVWSIFSVSIACFGSGHRLFHVFMEDGLYHALPATGALGAMQLKASETWNPKVQRIGIKERVGG